MNNTNSKYLVIAALILIAVSTRFMISIPNFTPLLAMAAFGGAMFSNKKLAYLVPISVMFLSDLFLGLHSSMLAVYAGFALTVFLGSKLIKKPSATNVVGSSFLGAIAFFAITNMSVWMFSGMYTQDWSGLVSCFTQAIPFFRNTLASTVLFSGALFGVYHMVEKTVLKPQTANSVK